jgi:cobalt-zinc-cadmium efflux system protein
MHRPHLRPSSDAERRALAGALWLTALLFVVEVVGGILSNSLALLSDAAHMLTDLLALGLAGLALRLAARPATRRRTFGYYRLEILSALANGILLALFAGGILVEAWNRFQDPPAVRTDVLLPVATAGLLVNVVAFWWLRRARGGLATRAATWHAASDGASSLLVLVAALIMTATGWRWIDPAASVLLAGVIVTGAYRLLRESVDVLLESVPGHLDVIELQEALCGVQGVEAVHDLHVWSLTSGVHALSGHLRVATEALADADRILEEAGRILGRRFGIQHTTLQLESERGGRFVCALVGEETAANSPSPGP